jgi:LacI family repressor for deo operon, udp, cdd, tsx, nupC, and nupG
MTTVKEVCRLAGVSTATVSRALKNPELVSAKTRERVFKAVQESGYRPNMLASSVKTGKSNSLVVLVPNLSNPFFLRIIQGIEQAAHEQGYSVLLGDTQGEPAREHEIAGMVLSNRADGLIHLDHSFPFSANDAHLADRVPVVSVCERIMGDKEFPVIELDNYAATRSLAKHLVNYGHRKFGIIAGQKDSQIHLDRLAGIKDVFANEGISLNDDMIVGGAYSIEMGQQGARDLMAKENRPTAIFCFNDDIALGTVFELKRMGIRVPQDVSVVGFDNIKVSAFIDPPLTTIDQPAHDMGRKAVEVVLQIIKGVPLKRNREIFPYNMLERESSGPVNPNF